MIDTTDRAIAIVGLGAILPDAAGVAAFWQNILGKRYSISETPSDRWSLADYYDPDPRTPDKTYSKIGGWVQGYEFDWKRFKMPPKVAGSMDQGQQWAVTIAADALADYGYPNRPLDTDRTAVVLGTAMGGELHYITNSRIIFPEYARALKAVPEFQQLPAAAREAILAHWHDVIDNTLPPITEDSMPGELPNIVSGRVANVLNLRGPNFITDAACASSFAAVDAAVELLTEHKVDAVLTGGVDRNMGISSFVKFCKIGALSATGTRPFGDGADGFVMGEGAAAFLLKRLEDAERAEDKIYAVIRGVGGASDGKGKGITAPNPIGQQLAMQRAWEQAGVDPATATLIEAHGTSTRVGDVVEVESLAKIFGAAAAHSIALGSVKSNIGHLKAGAGAAGLLKTTLALHHKIIPPTLNAVTPNPNIDFAHSPFYLAHEPREWPKSNGTPRRAAVSAYGFGGTNFHLALEEHVPGMLTGKKQFSGVSVIKETERLRDLETNGAPISQSLNLSVSQSPFRGILALGAKTPAELKDKLDNAVQRVEGGWTPPLELPKQVELAAAERLIIDFGNHEELLDKIHKAQKAMGFDAAPAWKALQAQGIFRGSGPKPGKIAFLFPGQGSQYLNMGRELAQISPIVAEMFAQADAVMTPILGQPLTNYLFVADEANRMQAEFALMQTAITQPAMLTLDTAMARLLASFGFAPDMVMGHSLGEYAALIAAGMMPFEDALEAAAARGSEMSKVSMGDNGKMAAVLAPIDVVEQTLKEVGGYVVPANINSYSQAVIGGSSVDVDRACQLFTDKGFRAIPIPVSHAFHTRIVAPASKPLREVLDRLRITPGHLPLVGNVTGDFYPHTAEAIKDMLEQQIASPVQWVKGLETLYTAGVRTFIEVGPKKALKGFVDDVLGQKADVISLFTNHPKTGELASFNQAICGLYAAGYGDEIERLRDLETQRVSAPVSVNPTEVITMPEVKTVPTNGTIPPSLDALSQLLQSLSLSVSQSPHPPIFDRATPPHGSVVITGTGLGLPGAEKAVMAPDNALRILRGEQLVDLIPERFRKRILAKRVTRLVKSEDGSGRFETINDPNEVIKLAGRPGYFDLTEEYGVPAKLVEALDSTTQLAMAAGLDALREAGIPLVQTFRKMSNGKAMPDRWLLPESLRDETGVVFASAFPGGDRFADEFSRYYTYQNRLDQINTLLDLRRYTDDTDTLREIDRRIADLRETLNREPYEFDRRFLFRILSMGHSQFAEYIGARGPNTQVNSACASTTQAIALAEDWIRTGRCRRVVVIGADNVTGDNMMEWVGAGFLATGAAATDDRVDEAALPFDRRRHGTLMGMGACALVLESEDAVRERGMRGVVELLASETNNSAFHGTRLDVNHIALVMNNLITTAERRFGLNRQVMTNQMVFMSHETFTPARGGSAAAEVTALRHTFGDGASEIIMANTKGFTGHPMGVGIEDVIALKILEYGIVPPVPNHKEIDPDLGPLNLSRGGRYPVQFALHLAAGFGSQIAMTLTRRIPGALDRVDNPLQYQRWLDDISGYDRAELEVVKRNLRIKADGVPHRTPIASAWRYGTEPVVRVGNAPLAAGRESLAVHHSPFTIHNSQFTPSPAPQPVVVEKPIPAEAVRVMTIAPEPVAIGSQQSAVNSEQAVVTSEPPLSTQPSVLSPQSSLDDIQTQVLTIVAQQTGYPMDMLDLELDMEADLGIDTVKQAETFAAIRKAFDIPRRDDLKLRDYPTLRHVVGFVKEMRPDLDAATRRGGDAATGSSEQLAVSSEPSLSTQHSALSTQSSVLDDVQAKVMAIVAEQTGYPQDMLELDLDMEADLGIDTVKQAETFAAIRKAFDIPRRDDLRLRDYPTLRHVVGFVKEMKPELDDETRRRGDGATGSSKQLAVSSEPSLGTQSSVLDEVQAKVMEIVAAQTGYPVEMLELDLDMEADLGIDTVKQAETFAAIRKAFDIPRRDDLKLRDYPTLRHVVGFVKDMRPELASSKSSVVSSQTTDQSPVSSLSVSQSPSSPNGKEVAVEPARPFPVKRPQPPALDVTNQVPRRVPTPVLRPQLPLCKPTSVVLGASARVIIQPDQGGVAAELTARLQALGVTVLTLNGGEVEKTVQEWLAAAPVTGVYWLSALDPEPALNEIDHPTWQHLNQVRVKELYTTLRTLYPAHPFLVTATRLGGQHGYGPTGAATPLGGSVTGFTKAFKREKGDCLVKAVDFDAAAPAFIAQTLIAETLHDPGLVEVGYRQGDRWGISLREQPLDLNTTPLVSLDERSVFVVTGAAGGITSAIIADLAAATGATFYLLDLAGEPNPDDPHITLFRQSKDALKQQLITEAKAAGEKPTPALIDKKIMAVERLEAALRAMETVQAAGGQAFYHSLDLRDGDAIAQVVNDIRQRFGRIDALIHAAGVEISRSLPDKDPAQFNLVYDVKADGFYHLLHAAADLPIGATVVFSSVAGRFGNNGQTDYSAANDLLCKWTSYLNQSGKTRAIALDWTAWGGIGMATRGSIPKIMEMAGIDMLPPEVGIPTVRRELLYGGGEIVVAGKLGLMVEEFDVDGGLDVSAAATWLAAQNPPYLMVSQLTSAPLYGPVTAETTLDPNEQPFLYDHAMDGVPLLPGVMGTETFAQLAQVLAPGYRVQAVMNEQFERPFKFHRMRPQTLTLKMWLSAVADGELLAHGELWSKLQPAKPGLPVQENRHFLADVRLSRTLAPAPKIEFTAPSTRKLAIKQDAIYQIYFHGPAYQVLERAQVEGETAVGLLAAKLPANTCPDAAAELMLPRLIELCFQTAGVWEIKTKGTMALPLAIGEVKSYPPSVNGQRLYALVQASNNGASFNAQVVDETGHVYVELKDYRTVQLPGSVQL